MVYPIKRSSESDPTKCSVTKPPRSKPLPIFYMSDCGFFDVWEVRCNQFQSVGFSTDGFATTPTMRKLNYFRFAHCEGLSSGRAQQLLHLHLLELCVSSV